MTNMHLLYLAQILKKVATHTRVISRLQTILLPKMPFFVRQKVQISSNILPQIPNFASFSPSEKEALSAVYDCYCC